MKGTFTLTRFLEDPDYMMFCNLGNSRHSDINLWGLRLAVSTFGRMLAHDLIEHTEVQRTCTATSTKEEYMAIGAVMFCRWEYGYDLLDEVSSLEDYPLELIEEGTEVNTKWYDLSDLFNEPEEDNLRQLSIQHYVNEGRSRVDEIFDGDRNKASNAFKFVEHQGTVLCLQLEEYFFINSVTVTFDTEKQIWQEDFHEDFDDV